MSTSDIKKSNIKTAVSYLVISAFLVLIGLVYEHFSHGVYSFYMVHSYIFALGAGAIFFLIIALAGRRLSNLFADVWGAFIATGTAGFLFKGIIEIYGTTSKYTRIFMVATVLTGIIGMFIFIRDISKK